MVSVRSAKNKGRQFEYSCCDSLHQRSEHIELSNHLGFVTQWDLIDHSRKEVFECKKHKGFTWNELVGYFQKLRRKSESKFVPYLLFQSNNNPCLVMLEIDSKKVVMEFEEYFKVPFIKHKGKKKGVDVNA